MFQKIRAHLVFELRFLVECVQESFNYEEMSSSQRKAIIILIEKQGKDRYIDWKLETYISRSHNRA